MQVGRGLALRSSMERSLMQRVHNPRDRDCWCIPTAGADEQRSAERSNGGSPVATSAFTTRVSG